MAAPLNAVASVVVSCPIRSAGSNPSFPIPNGMPLMYLNRAKAITNNTERSSINNGKIMYINAGLKHGFESTCFDSLKHSVKDFVNRSVRFCEENEGVRRASVLLMNALVAAPALAEEEKGKIFDFNLTLPIIAAEFLLLMLALDNIWFKPVAKVMDERDEAIRSKLLGVRDNSGEIKKLQEEAEAIIKAARAETTAALNQMKKETAAALEVKLQESKARIEEELAQALSNLEEQKKETLRSLDQQVQDLSEQILSKVIPADLSR